MAIHPINIMKTNLLFLLFLFSAFSVHAQTKFNDLPADYRKVGFPQLVEQCKGVFDGAYMAENKLSTHYDISGG